MHGVKALRLTLRRLQHARGNDRQSSFLEAAVDLADEIGTDAVGLDDGQGALERHSRLPFENLNGRFAAAGVPAERQAAQFTLGPAPAAMKRAMEVSVW